MCPKAIATRQYADKIPRAGLRKKVIRKRLKSKIIGVLILKIMKRLEIARIFVPVALRVSLIQKIHLGAQMGHIGLKKTSAKTRERYV